MTEFLHGRITSGGELPPPAALQAWPDLEASALSALAMTGTHRIPCLFHADDPIFLCPSPCFVEKCAGMEIMLADGASTGILCFKYVLFR